MQEIRINIEKKEKTVILLDNYKIVEKYEVKTNENIEGNIYIGVIKNIIPGIKAAFVDIGEEKNAFIHFEDMNKDEKDIKANERIFVQVQKNPIKQKGAKLTTNIKLTGRQIVLMPKTDYITVSRKITDESKKQELIKIVENNLPKGYGAIIRTSCLLASEEEIVQDIKRLVKRWKAILKYQEEEKMEFPCVIEENNNIIKSLILGTADLGMDKVITNSEKENKKISKFLKTYDLLEKVKVEYDEDVFGKYTINKELEDLNNSKVWLKCGGYIVIDKTEALTAIDINSGKCIGKNNLEDTLLKVNEEATKEIAKQIRLRDIGGIIIVDYIDMSEPKSKERIINDFEEEIKKDRAKIQVEGFSKLNLLELTRKQMYGKE